VALAAKTIPKPACGTPLTHIYVRNTNKEHESFCSNLTYMMVKIPVNFGGFTAIADQREKSNVCIEFFTHLSCEMKSKL
jgi:hypothetical protein